MAERDDWIPWLSGTPERSGSDTEDSPVSGGVGAARGFSGDEDDLLINMDRAEIEAFARDTGRSVAVCERRQQALQDGLSKMMRDG
ncbi:hypothetical protein QO034_06420 [Sedimentitalea sp. JM2-8]|uniref:Uncharacterized protein n=1 Tax=Sedimentitalea xiamensis TaxID=3050037 RepID=A0ABT7FCI9_9RHOB|nr:hypothetical protein [Sedimentitalea xiamensis]MDK3072738.1 hypothetical protein [Sedimentitalea xiamensis]